MILTLLLFSCSSDDEQTRSNNGVDYYTVHIVLSTGGNGFTRATPDHNNGNVSVEDGTGNENKIANVDLYVFEPMLDGKTRYDSKLIEKAINVTTRIEGANTVADGILFHLPRKQSEYGTNAEFQVVAVCNNSGAYSPVAGTTTLGDFISNLKYEYTTDFTKNLIEGTATIPMWGIVPNKLIADEETREVPQFTIPVLRAMAKVTVKMDLSSSEIKNDISLTGVSISNYNTGGYMAAQDNQAISDTAYVISSESFPIGSTNFNGDKRDDDKPSRTGINNASTSGYTPTGTSLSFQKVGDDEFVIYIPEFDNIDESSSNTLPQAYITLTLKTATGGTVYVNQNLYFADYTGGSSSTVTANTWDIIRNDHYKYTITSVSEGEMKINATALSWDVTESSIGWEGTGLRFISKDTEGRYCFLLRPKYQSADLGGHSALRVGSSSADYLLTLTGPKGAVWKAYLSNTKYFNLKIGEHASGGVADQKYSTIGITRTGEYRVTVEANYPWYCEYYGYYKKDDEGNYITNSSGEYEFQYTEKDLETPRTTRLEWDKDDWNRPLTPWGEIWEQNDGPETDLYITINTDGINEHELVINPTNNKDAEGNDGEYKDKRVFPGTDTRVRIKQLRPRKNQGYYTWGDGRYKDNPFESL